MRSTDPSKPLRTLLQGAINQRLAALRNGRSYRGNDEQVRVSIGRAQAFIMGYPVASDEQVKRWCRVHQQDVQRIVPSNAPETLNTLTR